METKESRSLINNEFYDDLEEKWHTESSHPVALLRAENRLRNPWIAEVIGKQQASILDIGCGAGFLTNYLSEIGHEVHGIDLSESSLKVAQRKDLTGRVLYQHADAMALPYPDQSFDVVCAMDILEHVEKPEQLIQEASRVLKKGGLFFFHTFSRNFLSWLLVIKGVEWFVRNTPKHMHVYPLFLNPEEAEALCMAAGLKVQAFRGVAPDFACKSFWKMLYTRTVDESFRFRFTLSLRCGYSAYARKLSC